MHIVKIKHISMIVAGILSVCIRILGVVAGMSFLIDTPSTIVLRQDVLAQQHVFFACLLFDALFAHEPFSRVVARLYSKDEDGDTEGI